MHVDGEKNDTAEYGVHVCVTILSKLLLAS